MAYYSEHRGERYRPGELPDVVGIRTAGDDPRSIIGTAFQNGWCYDPAREKSEAVWTLQVGKETVEGRFVLRGGRFYGLAEDAGIS